MDKIVFVIRTKDGKKFREETYRDVAERIVRDAATDPVMLASGMAPLSFAMELQQAVAA